MKPDLSYRGRANLLAGAWGAASVVVQTEILRAVMASSAGGTLGVGAVLGTWLAGIALGAPLGGRLARRPGNLLLMADCLAILAPAAAIFGLFYLASLRTVAGIQPGELVPLSALALHGGAACLPFSLIIGIGFPVLARLASSRDIATHDPAALFIGGIWSGEAAGAFCGGVVFTFLLAGRSGPALNVLGFSAVPLAATWLVTGHRHKALITIKALCAVLVAGALISGSAVNKFHADLCWKSTGAPGRLTESRWTRYGYLALASLSGQNTLYANSQPAASFPDRWADATTAALLLSQHPSPSHILVIGPAAYGPAQALLACGAQQVASVYPDRELERMLRRNLPGEMLQPLGEGYGYTAADPRSWLRGRVSATDGWDMVWINVDGPMQMNSSRYYTPSFFQLIRKVFSPAGGVLALRFPAAANAALPAQLDQAAAIIASLKTVFPCLQFALSPTHCHVFAADRESLLSGDLDTLMQRASRYERKVPELNRYLLSDFYDRGRIDDFTNAVDRTMESVQPHTDSTPTAWFHYIRLWSRMGGSSSSHGTQTGLLERLLDLAGELSSGRAIAALPLLITCLLLGLWLRTQASGGSETSLVPGLAVLTVAAVGFGAMEVTIAMIYLCQILFGALFYQVAMISATFMLALAAGSWWSSRQVPPDHLLPSALAMLLFLGAAAAGSPSAISRLVEFLFRVAPGWAMAVGTTMFYFTLVLTGLICGAVFPWTAAAFNRHRGFDSMTTTAAGLDSADHAGASLSAVAIGTILIPAFGLAVVGAGTGLMIACVALFWYALAWRR